MTLTIELPQDVESKLSAEAGQLGLTLPEYALHLLASSTKPIPAIKTGADLVAYWEKEGLFGMRPDITDSVAFAQANRERAQTRSRD